MCHLGTENRISAVGLTIRQYLNTMRNVSKIKDCYGLITKHRKVPSRVNVKSSCLVDLKPEKKWSEVIRQYLEKWKVTKELAIDKNAWKSFIKTYLTHKCIENRS